MAQPITHSWSKLSIWPGDGGTPEVFTDMTCGFVSKGFNLSATSADTTVPDCDDPDLPAWTERIIRSMQAGVSGNGAMAEETYDEWRTWMLSGAAKNTKIVLELNTPGYYQGRFLLTRLDTTGNQADAKIQV